MTAPRHRVIAGGFAAIRRTRADRWLRPLACGRGVILTCHHVRPARPGEFAPNRLLEITPEFLDRALTLVQDAGFELVPLGAVPDRLAAGGPPFAAVTFDDGYRDNVAHARPVLRAHSAPWTLFVPTEFADGRGRLWWVELERALDRLRRVRVPLAGTIVELPCRSPAERTAAFDLLYRTLRAGPEARLRATIGALAEEAGIDPSALVRELCLGWDELAELAEDPAVTIGAHTLTHPMLAKAPADVMRREIGESRTLLERRLGRPVHHLAYPVGDRASAGPREFAAARAAGYRTAVTTRPGHLFPAHLAHLHALPRVSVNGLFQSDAALAALLSGVPFLAWNRGRRVDVG